MLFNSLTDILMAAVPEEDARDAVLDRLGHRLGFRPKNDSDTDSENDDESDDESDDENDAPPAVSAAAAVIAPIGRPPWEPSPARRKIIVDQLTHGIKYEATVRGRNGVCSMTRTAHWRSNERTNGKRASEVPRIRHVVYARPVASSRLVA